MSNDTTTYDPTESVRTLTSAPFKETNMSLREHQDTDKHYIGDALPVPSASMLKNAGVPTIGVLPFPARADHSHDVTRHWTFVNTAIAMNTPPGSIYINTLQNTSWGRAMLVNGQVLAFPVPGLYFVQANFYIVRQGGGNFTNEMIINFVYANGASPKSVLRQSNFDLPNYLVVTVTDYAIAQTAPSATDNMQINIQHNDVVGWDVTVQELVVSRVGTLVSA